MCCYLVGRGRWGWGVHGNGDLEGCSFHCSLWLPLFTAVVWLVGVGEGDFVAWWCWCLALKGAHSLLPVTPSLYGCCCCCLVGGLLHGDVDAWRWRVLISLLPVTPSPSHLFFVLTGRGAFWCMAMLSLARCWRMLIHCSLWLPLLTPVLCFSPADGQRQCWVPREDELPERGHNNEVSSLPVSCWLGNEVGRVGVWRVVVIALWG